MHFDSYNWANGVRVIHVRQEVICHKLVRNGTLARQRNVTMQTFTKRKSNKSNLFIYDIGMLS
jgi:hypothetical protein